MIRTLTLYRTFLLVIILLILNGGNDATAQVSINFEHKIYDAISGTKLQANLIIKNHSIKGIRFTLNVDSMVLPIIGTIPSVLTLDKNDSILIPIQLYIPRRINGDSSYPIHVILNHEDDQKIYNASTAVRINAERNAYLQLRDPDVYLYNKHSPVEFYVRCINAGNTRQALNIHFRDLLTGNLQAPIATFYLDAFKDTTLLVQTLLNARTLNTNNPTIVLAGTYEDNSVFSQTFIQVRTVWGSKVYKESELPSDFGATNLIGLYSRFIGTPLQYYELMSNGNFKTPTAAISYSGNLSYFPTTSGANKLVLSNTMLNYQKDSWGMQLGNIYHGEEVSISGRGGSVNISTGSGGKITTGFINSSYNLLTANSKTGLYKPSNLLFASYTSNVRKPLTVTTSIKRIWDPQNGINGVLGGGLLSVRFPGNVHELTVGGYGSYSSVEPSNGGGSFSGASATVSYGAKWRKWQLASNNYISSKSYAGIMRGALNLDERINYSAYKWDAWARVHVSNNNPILFLNNFPVIENEYGSATAELGFQRRVNSSFSYAVKPYLYKENSFSIYSSSNNNVDMNAARLNISLIESGQSMQSFTLNADAGYFLKAPLVYEHTFSYRVNALYRYKWLNMSALVQEGPYYASEMRMYYYSGRNYKMTSLAAGVTKNLFRNKLMIRLTDMVMYDNTYNRWSNNISFTGTVRMNRSYMLEARLNKQQYGFAQGFTGVDIGIVKHFSPQRANTGTGSLHAMFFEDKNGNNQLDAGERGIPDLLVTINEQMFVTGAAGEIIYKAIPNGAYRIQLFQSKGFVADVRPITVNGKTVLQVPLHKLETMEGQIILKQQDFSFETDGNVSSIRIKATDRQGVVYTAVTNEEGRFIIYAPANDYLVQIEQESIPEIYELGLPPLTISLQQNITSTLQLELLVKKRQTKVIKFVSL